MESVFHAFPAHGFRSLIHYELNRKPGNSCGTVPNESSASHAH